MGTPKTWAIVAVILLVGVIGVFAFRHSEMLGKKPHSVNLHWEASPNATSYNIYRRTENTEFAKIGSSQTPSLCGQPCAQWSDFLLRRKHSRRWSGKQNFQRHPRGNSQGLAFQLLLDPVFQHRRASRAIFLQKNDLRLR